MSDLAATKNTELVAEHNTADEKAVFGFWTYIMTDGVLFASLFATYAVLHTHTNGGFGGSQLFEPSSVLIETMALLTSSFTCGMAILSLARRQKVATQLWLAVTFALGLVFLIIELNEFHGLVADGNGPARSAFLSGFFTLVGTHGLHITIGLTWIAAMIIKLAKFGFSRATVRQLQMLSIFWHFLDVVWIFIFTVVYMLGVAI